MRVRLPPLAGLADLALCMAAAITIAASCTYGAHHLFSPTAGGQAARRHGAAVHILIK